MTRRQVGDFSSVSPRIRIARGLAFGQEDECKSFLFAAANQCREPALTFTAPSSYWYLRWFGLPNMIKYADWINLMTYDLHGVWDASEPIGSIVQAHTNLTEIKLAADLFWRVNIPPAKIVMGFGFYGRSFTLSDTSCTTPRCPFKGLQIQALVLIRVASLLTTRFRQFLKALARRNGQPSRLSMIRRTR